MLKGIQKCMCINRSYFRLPVLGLRVGETFTFYTHSHPKNNEALTTTLALCVSNTL